MCNPIGTVSNPFEVLFAMLASVQESIVDLNLKVSKLQPTDETDTISIEEVAKMLNLAPRTIYNKTYQKQIPHTKRGKKIIFSKEKILKYIAEGEVKTINQQFRESEKLIAERIKKKEAIN